MKRFFLMAVTLSLGLSAQAQSPAASLHDLLSPDEVAAELGLETPLPFEMSFTQATSGPKVSFASQASWILRYFPVVVVINKAAKGPTAQRAQIYMDGTLFWDVPVSTGREQMESSKSGKKYFSATSLGWFAPTWQVENHFSKTWEAPMPWSTFFNGGIAIHAALPAYYGKLGSRASGGCVRMHPTYARSVFELIRSSGKGLVPEFTRYGGLKTDAQGNLIFRQGWNSLIIVEDRPGK